MTINGLKWTTYNIGAASPAGYGNYYTWDQAMLACPSGWRLPTSSEFAALFSNVANNTAWSSCSTGNLGTVSGVKGAWGGAGAKLANTSTAIFFPFAGYDGGTFSGEGGYFWSSTGINTSDAYCLAVYTTIVRPQFVDSKTYQFSVRCVQ